MNIVEAKRRLMDLVGSLALPNRKLDDFVSNEIFAERKKIYKV